MNIRSSGATESEKFFLSMQIDFRRLNFGALASRRGGVRGLNGVRKINLDLGSICLCYFAGVRPILPVESFLFRMDKACVLQVRFEPHDFKGPRFRFDFGERAHFLTFRACGIFPGALQVFFQPGKIENRFGRGITGRSRFVLQVLRQEGRFNFKRFSALLRDEPGRDQRDDPDERAPAHAGRIS